MGVRTAIYFFGIILLGCGPTKKSLESSSVKRVAITNTDSLSGLEVVKQSDCYSCHHVTKKLSGPSFSEIAQRYDADIPTMDRLASKIINGGPGAWGKIPMTPHPVLSKGEIEDAVKYILSLKKLNQ